MKKLIVLSLLIFLTKLSSSQTLDDEKIREIFTKNNIDSNILDNDGYQYHVSLIEINQIVNLINAGIPIEIVRYLFVNNRLVGNSDIEELKNYIKLYYTEKLIVRVVKLKLLSYPKYKEPNLNYFGIGINNIFSSDTYENADLAFEGTAYFNKYNNLALTFLLSKQYMTSKAMLNFDNPPLPGVFVNPFKIKISNFLIGSQYTIPLNKYHQICIDLKVLAGASIQSSDDIRIYVQNKSNSQNQTYDYAIFNDNHYTAFTLSYGAGFRMNFTKNIGISLFAGSLSSSIRANYTMYREVNSTTQTYSITNNIGYYKTAYVNSMLTFSF